MTVDLVKIVAFITVLSTAIYILGLIALCWPIYQKLTRDASTALYAASLVPRTVVAGHGVRIFVGFPLIAALCLITVVSMARWEPIIVDAITHLGEEHILQQVILGLVATGIALFFIKSVERLRDEDVFDFFFTPLTNSDSSPIKLLSIALSAIGGAIGGWLILTDTQVSWGTLFLALVFFFGATALAGVPDAVSINPPLPQVSVKVTDANNGSETRTINGKLLAHTEGLWYIFEDDNNILLTLPDKNTEVECIQAR